MSQLNPGIYYGVSFDEYKAINACNASILKHARVSMAHVLAAIQAPDKDTPAKRFGRMVHTAILEPEQMQNFIGPPINPKTQKAYGSDTQAWEKHQEANPGKTIASDEDLAAMAMIQQNIRAHPQANILINHDRSASGTNVEACMVWKDAATGVLCKGRMDLHTDAAQTIDIKTCQCAAPAAFQRVIAARGYHFAAAFYRRGQIALGLAPTAFLWCAIESKPPYSVMVYEPTDAMMEVGEAEVDRALHQYAEALKTGYFPGYQSGIHPIELTPFYASDLLGSGD